MTPNIGLTTVVATLVHGALITFPLMAFLHHPENRQAEYAVQGTLTDVSTPASGIETDPASGANRAPVPAATEAQSWASESLIEVDVSPSSPDPGAASPTDLALADPNPQAPAGRGGRVGGLKPRAVRSAKHTDSIKAANAPIEIDMGQPGGVDALLFGEGSPGLSHDLSSPPRIGGRVYWECPWPSAAARAGINHAVVHVTVDVTARGEAKAVQLIDQSGYEFGEDAVRCAMDQRYIPGRDAGGKPVAGRTRKFSVQFNRRGAGAGE